MTWINYQRFNECIKRYYETGETFSEVDYWAETPNWALYNSVEGGFNPQEQRVIKKSKKTRAQAEEESKNREETEGTIGRRATGSKAVTEW